MWLTGFDVQNLSTLYLDKPMKGHTLMQAIARANRVCPGKASGIIVDYVNVFKYMQEALSDYATGDDGAYPAKNIDNLLSLLDDCVNEGEEFLKSNGLSLVAIIQEKDTNAQLGLMETALNKILEKDDTKNRFRVITNTMIALHDASKPEVFEKHWDDSKFKPLKYIHDLMENNVDDEKLNRAKERMAHLLDTSVISQNPENSASYKIHEGKVIDLSKIDIEELRKEINSAQYKALEIETIKDFIEDTIKILTNKNCERIKFSERFKSIIDQYNAGGSENEDYYEKLLQLIEDLKVEEKRAEKEGLTEEELELYDLLVKGKKLRKAEEQKVKLAAKGLYKKLTENKDKLFIVQWYKDDQPIAKVKDAIEEALDDKETGLPECYDKELFDNKTQLLLNHFIDMSVQGYSWLAA